MTYQTQAQKDQKDAIKMSIEAQVKHHEIEVMKAEEVAKLSEKDKDDIKREVNSTSKMVHVDGSVIVCAEGNAVDFYFPVFE